MKQKDIFLIVAVVFFTGLISYFATNAIFGTDKKREEKVEVVEPITADFQKPDSKYFNTGSIDPTQPITIGDSQNPKPFNSSGN